MDIPHNSKKIVGRVVDPDPKGVFGYVLRIRMVREGTARRAGSQTEREIEGRPQERRISSAGEAAGAAAPGQGTRSRLTFRARIKRKPRRARGFRFSRRSHSGRPAGRSPR